MLERLECSLNNKKIQPVHPKGNQSSIFIGRIDAEASILWPPDMKSLLTGKDSDAGKDWGQEGKGVTEDEMVGWHHWPTQWTWVWANSWRYWRTGKSGVLQSMGALRVGSDSATQQQQQGLLSIFESQTITFFYAKGFYICCLLHKTCPQMLKFLKE